MSTSAAYDAPLLLPSASVVIDVPAASPSHSHPPPPHPSSSLERYWPLIAVTLASIYLITLVPFVAPGLFLIQFSLLRYIRHHSDKADASHASAHHMHLHEQAAQGGRRGGERVRRRSLGPPAMDVIVEETETALVDEERSPSKDRLLLAAAKHTSPMHTHRPPPLVIPFHDMGVVTRPTLLPSPSSPVFAPSSASRSASAAAASTLLPSTFPLAQPSSAWSDASQEFSQLLSSSLQLLQVERQRSTDELLAATASLLHPLVSSYLTAHSHSPCSAASSNFSPRASSFASTASTDVDSSPPAYSHSPYTREATSTPQRREAKKGFSFDRADFASSGYDAHVIDPAVERRMDQLMRRV